MNNLLKTSLPVSISILSTCILSACVNQNTIVQKKLTPVTNACPKISALITAYDNNFEQVKISKIKANSSSNWKAKYNLIGENCTIWSWGGTQTTYACSISANNKQTAENYYADAKKITQQCLDNSWTMTEVPRKHDNGLKTTFTTPNKVASISAHLVPTGSIFNEKWTLYYYIGKPKL